MTRANVEVKPGHEEASWQHLLTNARLELDKDGRPILQMRSGDSLVEVGITRDNVLQGPAPPEFAQELLVARLREELRSGNPPRISETELRKDWELLKTAFSDKPSGAEALAGLEVSGLPETAD